MSTSASPQVVSRRGLLQRLGLLLLGLPLLKLGPTLARAERRRAYRRGVANGDDIWLGHY